MPPKDSTTEVELPTTEEIHASTQFLCEPYATKKVVLIRKRFAVKFGGNVSLSEAEAMKFIAYNTNVRVPKVHAAYTDSQTKISYIIMDYAPGQILESLAPTLSAEDKVSVWAQIRGCIEELRKTPSQGFFGAIGRKPYNDALFWSPDSDPQITGPFETEAEMNEGILARLLQSESKLYVQFIRNLMEPILRNHRPVLTHGYLQPKNIVVNRIGSHPDGSSKFEVTLIGWEMCGWYPEFWEYCTATMYVVSSLFRLS